MLGEKLNINCPSKPSKVKTLIGKRS
uniref:Uncharacterized protein n=1 Tax=Anguilla anguilla TaxID=7936 RepID=A0A0E9P9A7_ANGAN